MTEGNTRIPRNDTERDIANAVDTAALACGANLTPDQLLFLVEATIDAYKEHMKDALEEIKAEVKRTEAEIFRRSAHEVTERVQDQSKRSVPSWNHIPVPVYRGSAVVVPAPKWPLYWAKELVGQRVRVVQVRQNGRVMYLFDGDGTGWYKLTHGGGPELEHKVVEIADASFYPCENWCKPGDGDHCNCQCHDPETGGFE